jgi:hypothetical protein
LSEFEATFKGVKLSWGTEILDFWLFIVIMLAGEKEKIPAGFCGDAVKIVCCPTGPPADKTEMNVLVN